MLEMPVFRTDGVYQLGMYVLTPDSDSEEGVVCVSELGLPDTPPEGARGTDGSPVDGSDG